MSKQFFTVIGDQLCSLKNSPFTRIGQKKQLQKDGNLLKSQLSYDPDRLFNREKYLQKIESIEDKDFVELKKQQIREEEKIQFQMLREATKQDFQRRLKQFKQKSQQMKTAKKIYSIFRTPRTFCQHCNKCGFYRGNFNHHTIKIAGDNGKQIEFLGCLNCKCPMNAHMPTRSHNSMKTQIWSYLKTKQITQQHINMSYYILSFKVQEQKSAEEQLFNLIQFLERVRINTYSYKIIEKWDFQMGLLQGKLLKNGENLGLLQTSLRLAECIKEFKKWKGVKVDEAFQQNLNVLKKIALQLKSKFLSQLRQNDNILLLLIKIDNQSQFNSTQFKHLFQSLQEYITSASLLYLPDSKQQSILLSQIFFPHEYTLNKRLFLLPRSENQEDFLRFKDILDYNNYSIFFQNINNVRRDKIQTLLNFLSFHELTYIMGKQIVNENISKLQLIYAAKAGTSKLNHYGKTPAFIQVQSDIQKQKLVNQLFLEYSMGQRCLIILRPFIIASGLEQIIVNLLRINNFIIIQRVRGTFTTEHANYLGTLEHIEQKDLQAYSQFMTSGQCELILVSKKSAIYEAHSLLNQSQNALADINPRWIRNRPTIQIKKGRQTYLEEVKLFNHSKQDDVFVGANSLLNIERCLFGSQWTKQAKILQNIKTGQLLKVEEMHKQTAQLKSTLRQKQQILWQLRSQTFNFMLFNSKSDKSTQDLVSIFFPQCTLFQSVVLIVKPSYVYLLDEIKRNLNILKYYTIFSKVIQLSKHYAEELIHDLQKIKIDHIAIKEIAEHYHNQKVVFLCLSKISARKQMLSLLSNFSFLPNRTLVQHEKCQEMLKEVLVPIWSHQEKYLTIFNRNLSNLQQAVEMITNNIQEGLKKQQRIQMIQYFVGSIFGIKYEEDGNSILGKLSIYSTVQQSAKFQSWYYSCLSNIYPSLIPLLFQYRSYGEQTLVIQTNCGQPFMTCVINQYLDQKKQIQKHYALYPQRRQSKRGSLVLLIWAKKIFNFIQQISTLSKDCKTIPIQLEGWGNISYINNQYRGELNQQKSIQLQKQFLQLVIKKYNSDRYIVANCQKMLSSRIIPQKYKTSQRRLLPRLSDIGIQQSIRVVQRQLINKLYLKDKFEMIDPDNQKNNQEKDLLQLNLYHIIPYIGTKYELLAELLLYLEQLKEESLEYSEVFIQILDHIKGFLNKYQDLQFLEYQIYLKSLIKLMKNEKNVEQLKIYPNLRKHKKRINNQEQQDGTGKKRKHLDQNKYFKGNKQYSEEYLQEMKHIYSNFNIKTLEQPMKNHVLNKDKDPLHQKWMKQENIVNLLRQKKYTKDNREVQGIFVEYQTVINQNQQKIKRQLMAQVQKINFGQQQTILRENGLDNEIWYRRVREGNNVKKPSKVQDAISKQLQKLNQFKSTMSDLNKK